MFQIISTRRHPTALAATVAVLVLLGGCGTPDPLPEAPRAPTLTPVPKPAADSRVVVLGDSLAAGYGLPVDDAYPAILERLLQERGSNVEVVNAGVSGDTSAGGLSRLEWVLGSSTDVLVVELGGNDGLRGQSLANTESNLREIVRGGRAAGAAVVLAGMDVPTNYGPDYGEAFSELFPRIAEEEGAVLAPGFVRVLGERPELLQPDGLHPTADGQRILAEQLVGPVTEALEATRQRRSDSGSSHSSDSTQGP